MRLTRSAIQKGISVHLSVKVQRKIRTDEAVGSAFLAVLLTLGGKNPKGQVNECKGSVAGLFRTGNSGEFSQTGKNNITQKELG